VDIDPCLRGRPLVLVAEDEADWNWDSGIEWTTLDNMVCL